MADIETINIGEMNSSDPLEEPSSNQPSINFGSGIELLMNDKKKKSESGANTPTSDINLGDLQSLEQELNELSDTSENKAPSMREARSAMFSGLPTTPMNVSFSDKNDLDNLSIHSLKDDNNLNIDTNNLTTNTDIQFKVKKDVGNEKTWDGFGKFNDIPIDPEKNVSSVPNMSKEELLREKFKYLKKLEELEKKGADVSKKYTMESSLQEMQGEYETIIEEKELDNSKKFQGKMLMACITGLEFLNNKFDPFDLKLDGWSEQVNDNLDDYDEIFSELHEKYRSKAKMAPELKLLFQLGGSAIMLHMTNTLFKSSMPGMDDIMRQNPELMQQFTQAAVNQMGQTNPGLGGFMNNMMNEQNQSSRPNTGPPPPPMRTQGPNAPPPPQRNSRPDLNFARNAPSSDGISITESFEAADPPQRSKRIVRPEMKGPSDINDILSGLKPKTSTQPTQQQATSQMFNVNDAPNLDVKEMPLKEDSTISISDLKELQNANLPKKSKRRKTSEKNTISLDI